MADGDSSGAPEKKGHADDNRPSDSKKQTTKTPVKKSTVTLTLPKWLFWGGILVGVLGVGLNFSGFFDDYPSEELLDLIGADGVYLFQQYDRDGDNYLSLDEFEPLVHRLIETNVSIACMHEPTDVQIMVSDR